MSGNMKYKITVRNNAGKTTPAATAPMANAYANAIVPKKNRKNLAATFSHRKCNETSLRFLFLNIKRNDKPQNPLVNRGKRKRNKSITQLGRYVLGHYIATEHAHGSRTQLGRYVATENVDSSDAT
ncbi:hypothetical protein F2Q69_00028576 [Brassica cretica]|uniref:Uncharacterized protein n=1 Tax=Brassica cretica TaxID=69181 RepID=A0A8S9S8F5_BRACR|nr:hypothetical protein F2Q69_00028576 [Brassica cretica]